jgi:hypothetical protein
MALWSEFHWYERTADDSQISGSGRWQRARIVATQFPARMMKEDV